MISQKRSSSAAVIGGKTARACDGCLLKRARWYCAADDALLCQGCDSSVHSANLLASRHERVRLTTTSSSLTFKGTVPSNLEESMPAWHRGFTRKARTPRHSNKPMLGNKKDEENEKYSEFSPLIVPEIGNEESPLEESEEQILCRVPVFDPFDTKLCDVSNEEEKAIVGGINALFNDGCHELDGFQGFLPSDMELAEFAADVESLLGREGSGEDSCSIKELREFDCKERPTMAASLEGVKIEEEEEEIEAILACQFDPMLDMARETLDWQFDYESPIPDEEEEEAKMEVMEEKKMMNNRASRVEMKRKMLLTLNYEGVITAWASHGCPWTNGIRPDFDLHNWRSDFMGMCTTNVDNNPCEDHVGRGLGGQVGGIGNGERDARVLRYREKRRTRLFSKKIRYEVRKLNAEKRPRMKGRFVKRTSFAGTTFS